MKIIKAILPLLVCCFAACAPETESRAHMDNSSQRMSDSILKLLDSSFAEPARNLAGTWSPIASSASSFTPVAEPK